jgi:hypothetical protein
MDVYSAEMWVELTGEMKAGTMAELKAALWGHQLDNLMAVM